ncbi:hypothetical protein RBB50_003731 [Rhinocladiella similis]
MAGSILSRIAHRLRSHFRIHPQRSSSATPTFTSVRSNTVTDLQPSTAVTSSDTRTPALQHDYTDSLLLLSIMAGQGPTSLIVKDVPFDPITSLGDVERRFTGAEGFIGAKISDTRLSSTAMIVQDFVFEFSTTADAARGLQSRTTITIADRAYTVQPHGGEFGDPQYHVGEAVQPNEDQPIKGTIRTDLKCSICMVEFGCSAPAVPCRRCKFPRCFDCLKADFKAAMEDMDRMPLRCCNTIIHHETAREILSTVELEAYKSRFDELSTINPLYCPVPTCSTFLPPRTFNEKGSEVTCPTCNTRVCTNCKQVAHHERGCSKDLGRELILGMFHYKTCPKCGTAVAKMYGCPHMRCKCGAHWCWDCQRPLHSCYQRPCQVARDNGNGPQDESGDEDVDANTDDDEPGNERPNVSQEQEANGDTTNATGNDNANIVPNQEDPQNVQMPRAHTDRDSNSINNGNEQLSGPANLELPALLVANHMRDSLPDKAEEESGEQRTQETACVVHGEIPMTAPDDVISSSATDDAVVAQEPENGCGNNTMTDETNTQTQAGGPTNTDVDPDTTSRPEDDETRDLDHPNMDDWEEGDFDLGNEPYDELWDIWGCRHRFRLFSTATIPDFWIIGIDAQEDEHVEIECMACFRKGTVSTHERGSKPRRKSPQAQDQQPNIAKPETWECKICGVIVCKPCMKAEKKRMMRELNSGD